MDNFTYNYNGNNNVAYPIILGSNPENSITKIIFLSFHFIRTVEWTRLFSLTLISNDKIKLVSEFSHKNNVYGLKRQQKKLLTRGLLLVRMHRIPSTNFISIVNLGCPSFLQDRCLILILAFKDLMEPENGSNCFGLNILLFCKITI